MNLYGSDWITEVWKLIQEDKTIALRDLVMIAPIARTAMDKKSGKALQNYTKNVYRVIEKRTPWLRRRGGKLSHLRGKVPSGEVRVILGQGEDGNLDLFKGVRQVRE